MAKPQGFTAEAMPAARANRAEAPTSPPSQEPESPDNRSTNRFTSSIPLSLPIIKATINAVARAIAATPNGIIIVRVMLRSFELIILLIG